MKTVSVLLACAVAGAFVPLAAEDKEPDKFGPEKLAGKWVYVSGIKDGAKADADNLKKQVATFTKDRITLTGEAKFVLKYELDTSKKPAGIKLEMLESPFGAGAKAVGIIEVTGDEMRFCYASMGDTPPKTFDAKEGSKLHLFVLKRAK